MAFHIFGHIEALQFNTHAGRQLLGDFGFADTSGAREQIGTNWFFRFT